MSGSIMGGQQNLFFFSCHSFSCKMHPYSRSLPNTPFFHSELGNNFLVWCQGVMWKSMPDLPTPFLWPLVLQRLLLLTVFHKWLWKTYHHLCSKVSQCQGTCYVRPCTLACNYWPTWTILRLPYCDNVAKRIKISCQMSNFSRCKDVGDTNI